MSFVLLVDLIMCSDVNKHSPSWLVVCKEEHHAQIVFNGEAAQSFKDARQLVSL